MDQIFGKVLSGELKLNFFGPAGGSRTRKGAFAPGRAEKIEFELTREHFFKNLVHFTNLEVGRSRAIEFPQTSHLHHQNPHAKSFRLEASQRNP